MLQLLCGFLQCGFKPLLVPDHSGCPAHTQNRFFPDFSQIGFFFRQSKQLHSFSGFLHTEFPGLLRLLPWHPVSYESDIFRSPDGTCLPGIESRPAGPGYAVASAYLSHRKNPFYIGLPVTIRRKPAIIMLNTDSDLQHFLAQVNSMLQIK